MNINTDINNYPLDNKVSVISFTISKDNWTSKTNTVEFFDKNSTSRLYFEDNSGYIAPYNTQDLNVISSSKISISKLETNKITFKCETVPTSDIKMVLYYNTGYSIIPGDGFLPLTGGIMDGDIDMSNCDIINVGLFKVDTIEGIDNDDIIIQNNIDMNHNELYNVDTITISGDIVMNGDNDITGAHTITATTFVGNLTGNADNATHIYAATIDPGDITSYNIPLYSGSSNGNKSLFGNNGIVYLTSMGTADTEGNAVLALGNSIVSGTERNKYGRLRLFSKSNGFVDVQSSAITTTNRTITLPDKSGTVALLDDLTEAYTHPSYTPQSSGLYKITVDELGHISAAATVTKADITDLGIPGSDTTYNVFNTTTNGLVPAPTSANTTKFLRGDGSWAEVAVGDHNHDDTYLKLSGGTMTGGINYNDEDNEYPTGITNLSIKTYEFTTKKICAYDDNISIDTGNNLVGENWKLLYDGSIELGIGDNFDDYSPTIDLKESDGRGGSYYLHISADNILCGNNSAEGEETESGYNITADGSAYFKSLTLKGSSSDKYSEFELDSNDNLIVNLNMLWEYDLLGLLNKFKTAYNDTSNNNIYVETLTDNEKKVLNYIISKNPLWFQRPKFGATTTLTDAYASYCVVYNILGTRTRIRRTFTKSSRTTITYPNYTVEFYWNPDTNILEITDYRETGNVYTASLTDVNQLSTAEAGTADANITVNSTPLTTGKVLMVYE